MTIEELFGTLQQATVASWRKHLRTAKYAKHEALDEFYKELPEMVDALIEGYMGAYGKKVKNFENILKSSNMNTIKYLQELKKVCKDGYDLLDENEELESLLDDIVNLINSTLYKVKELNEHKMKDLVEFINESLVNEKKNNLLAGEYTVLDVINAIEAVAPDIKWYKELRNNSVDDVLEYYTIYDMLERELEIEVDDIYDFIMANEDEFERELNDL